MQRLISGALFLLLTLSACALPAVESTPTAAPETTVPTQAPTLTSTPEPPATLTVCTSGLPESLYLYDGRPSPAKEALLALTLEGPFDDGDGTLTPAIVEQVPDQANGGLDVQPVTVQRGQTVVDARGDLVVLKPGVTIRPSGCSSSACALAWDGVGVLEMDQMRLTFRLVAGLTWSDGTPVTAADSVFSYDLASAPDTPGLQWAETHTESYTAQDEQTLQWVGKPGFTTAAVERFLWTPLPAHVPGEAADGDLVMTAPQFSTMLVSYGPFMVTSYEADAIRLERNPYYFRSDEGLPVLDEVTMKVLPDPSSAVAALKAGTCDVLDASFGLQNDPQTVAELQADGDYQVLALPTGSWEQLVFGINPASYDEYYNPVYGDRPDFFGDSRVRQAVAACLDRETMLQAGLPGVTNLWPSFLPTSDSQLESAGLGFDPVLGMSLLEQAGWRDHDLDPETALQAWDVATVPAGTVFNVELLTDTSGLHQALAAVVRDSLGECGIDVTVTALPLETVYAPGPEGPLFGRAFDLTLLSWQPLTEMDCGLYQSWQVPSDENQWIGTNIAGYVGMAYDAACVDANLALPDTASAASLAAETEFIASMPAVPMVEHVQVMIVRVVGCTETASTSGDSFYERLESYAGDKNCP